VLELSREPEVAMAEVEEEVAVAVANTVAMVVGL
jgi:hypothetical protein